jgi:hypothetical protein
MWQMDYYKNAKSYWLRVLPEKATVSFVQRDGRKLWEHQMLKSLVQPASSFLACSLYFAAAVKQMLFWCFLAWSDVSSSWCHDVSSVFVHRSSSRFGRREKVAMNCKQESRQQAFSWNSNDIRGTLLYFNINELRA